MSEIIPQPGVEDPGVIQYDQGMLSSLKHKAGRIGGALLLTTSGAVASFVAHEALEPVPAYASTGGYPNADAPCVANNNNVTSGSGYWCNGYQWGYYIRNTSNTIIGNTQNSGRGYGYRNCTDWSAWRVPQLTGVNVPSGWSHAYNWDTKASQAGYTVDNSPEPGDIAQTDDGSYGHVGVVEGVTLNAQGVATTITVSEYNKSQDGNYTLTSYAKNANGVFTRGTNKSWQDFLDLNGTGVGLNGEAWPPASGGNTPPPPPVHLESSPIAAGGVALHILARGVDDEFYDKAFNGTNWNGLHRLSPGSVFESSPAMVVYGGEPRIVGKGVDDELYLNSLSGGNWSGFTPLEVGVQFQSDPIATQQGNALHVFAVGNDNEIYDKAFNGSTWNTLHRLAPGSVFQGKPTAVATNDKLHVIGRGVDDELYVNNLVSGSWSGFQRMSAGSLFESDPVAVTYAGETHLVARGNDNQIYKNTLTSTGWTGFSAMSAGSVFKGNVEMVAQGNYLTVIGRGVDNQLYANTFTGTSWNGFVPLQNGAIFESDPQAAPYANETHVMARGVDHELYKSTMTSTGWTPFERLEPGAIFEG